MKEIFSHSEISENTRFAINSWEHKPNLRKGFITERGGEKRKS